jgi:hypothetical protein
MSAVIEGAAAVIALLTTIRDKLAELKPKEVQTVKIITDPYEFSKTVIDRISTTLTARPDKPQIEIANPVDRDVRIMSMTLIPDAAFKTKGLLLLKNNDADVFEVNTGGDLTDFSTINVPLPNEGLELKRGKKIRLFTWTSDGMVSAITVMIHFQR